VGQTLPKPEFDLNKPPYTRNSRTDPTLVAMTRIGASIVLERFLPVWFELNVSVDEVEDLPGSKVPPPER